MVKARTWVFDLDNTLHYCTPHIFPHMNRSMTEYVMQHLGLAEAEASALRRRYWLQYGATLLGLMKHHDTDPDHFLHETHQFPELDRMVIREMGLRALLRPGWPEAIGRRPPGPASPPPKRAARFERVGVVPEYAEMCAAAAEAEAEAGAGAGAEKAA